MIKSKNRLDLPLMMLDLEYKFQMICLRELMLFNIEREPNVGCMNVRTWEKVNAKRGHNKL